MCKSLPLLGALIMICSSSCGSDFTPFNEVDRLRVLVISADPPWLVPTSSAALPSTTLTALVAHDIDTSTATVRFEWSWCPLRAGSAAQGDVGAYECSFGPGELNEMLGLDPTGQPDEFPLGDTASVELEYPLPPDQIAMICNMLSSAELPEFVEIPSCDNGFPISVRLIARLGDEEVITVKDVRLAYEDGASTNAVPRIGKIVAKDPANPSMEVELDAAGTTTLKRDVNYMLEAEIFEADSEAYTTEPAFCAEQPIEARRSRDARENLTLTWFIGGGETNSTRTGWLPDSFYKEIQPGDPDEPLPPEGQEDVEYTGCAFRFDSAGSAQSLERARMNEWKLPKKVDYDSDDIWLHVVIRDGRQGASFVSRRVKLEE